MDRPLAIGITIACLLLPLLPIVPVHLTALNWPTNVSRAFIQLFKNLIRPEQRGLEAR